MKGGRMSLSMFPSKSWTGPSNRSKSNSGRLNSSGKTMIGSAENWRRPSGPGGARLATLAGAPEGQAEASRTQTWSRLWQASLPPYSVARG